LREILRDLVKMAALNKNVEFKDYQRRAVNKIRNRGSLLVAHGTGTGKCFGMGESRVNEQILMKLAAYGDATLQKEAAYGDTVKALGRKILGAAEDAAIDKFLQSKTNEEFRRAGLRADAIRAANRFVQENAKGITTGALTVGTSGALAGARALITRQREREKTASYYAVREMLGLDKEASQAPNGTQQEISKRRRHQALEDAILENPRVG
jgi:hypothetical protein